MSFNNLIQLFKQKSNSSSDFSGNFTPTGGVMTPQKSIEIFLPKMQNTGGIMTPNTNYPFPVPNTQPTGGIMPNWGNQGRQETKQFPMSLMQSFMDIFKNFMKR